MKHCVHYVYLLAYDGKKMRVYRIDHMEGVEIEEADAQGLEEFKKIKLSDYTKQTFGMYGGKIETVTMRLANNMVVLFWTALAERSPS